MAKVIFHCIKYFLGMDSADTQTTQAERDAIARSAAGKRRAVEIGVFEGVTTSVIAAALPEGATLYAVDPFIAGRMGICWGKSIAHREARRRPHRCQIEFVQAFSHAAFQKVDGNFDFIFIDADHSLKGITEDWTDWSDRIEAGGLIALHDTVVPAHNPRVAEFGSHKYFVEHIQHDPRFELVEQVDSLSILKRKA